MTADRELEGRLTALFSSSTAGHAPADLHTTAMAQIAGVRQRPTVLARLRGERLRHTGGATRVTRVVLVVAGLALLALAAAFGAGAFRAIASGTITYVSSDASEDAGNPGTYSIWSVRGDGTGNHRIGGGECPSLSADGANMVFVSGRYGDYERDLIASKGQIIAASADGSGQRVLTDVDATRAAISPDGSAVAWIKDLGPITTADGNWQFGHESELWVSPVSGGAGVRVVAGPATNVSFSDVVWSPAGDRLAFVQRDVVIAGADAEVTAEASIWVVNANGSSLVRLGTPAQRSLLRREAGHTQTTVIEATPISWSPDGQALAYLRLEERPIPGPGPTGYEGISQLTVLAADGSHETRIAASYAGPISWSPNGRYIAFQHLEGLTTVEIIDGSPVGPQHRAPVNGLEPLQLDIGDWSADSKHLLIVATRPQGPEEDAGSGAGTSRLLVVDPELRGPPSLLLDPRRSIGDSFGIGGSVGCPVVWSNP
jgi:Tol biopolymer transport system component